MASTSETGHATNLANFKKEIDMCVSFGADYNPSNPKLLITAMTAQWTAANDAHSLMKQSLANGKQPINAREILFEPLSKLITRVMGHLNSTDASAAIKKDIKGLADRIRGFGVRKPKAETPAKTENAESNPDDELDFVSKSHLSFVERADTLDQMIKILKTEALYTPNEADITLTSLATLYKQLKTANDGIGNIISNTINARNKRNAALYNATDGVIETGQKCKEYVKSLYGASAAQYKAINRIRLRTIKE